MRGRAHRYRARMKVGGWLADLRGPAAALGRLFKCCENRLIPFRQRWNLIRFTWRFTWAAPGHRPTAELWDTVIRWKTEYHLTCVQSDLRDSIHNPPSGIHAPRYLEALHKPSWDVVADISCLTRLVSPWAMSPQISLPNSRKIQLQ
jgi:hypothetical protein